MQTIHRHTRRESVLISGGFPCQDASKANFKGKGINGSRTGGGWREMYRIIREVRPEYVFVENVPNLLRRGWGQVITDFYTARYHVWWRVIPAKNFGFPFEGERIYALAFEAACFGWEAIQDFNKCFEQEIQVCRPKTLPDFARDSGKSFFEEYYTELLRADYGLPAGAYRIASLGNACIPLFPEIILTALKKFDEQFFNPPQ